MKKKNDVTNTEILDLVWKVKKEVFPEEIIFHVIAERMSSPGEEWGSVDVGETIPMWELVSLEGGKGSTCD